MSVSCKFNTSPIRIPVHASSPKTIGYVWILDADAITSGTAASSAATSASQWIYGAVRGRRTPHQSNARSPEAISTILAEAIARPTLGPRSLLRHRVDRGIHRSASEVAKVLRRHHLGTARQRVAALASLMAADAGLVTGAALEGPLGFCLFAACPGQVVSLDTSYVGL
jgi:hypothetical protein